jgi:hypothetical protein
LVVVVAIERDMQEAIRETDAGVLEKFQDGEALQQLQKTARKVLDRLMPMMASPAWRTVLSVFQGVRGVRLLTEKERVLVSTGIEMLTALIKHGDAAISRLRQGDWPKILSLLLEGRPTYPFMLMGTFCGMINSSLKAIVWNQKAEIVTFLISAVSATNPKEKMLELRHLIGAVLTTRLIQGGVGELESVLEQAGIYQFENTLQMCVPCPVSPLGYRFRPLVTGAPLGYRCSPWLPVLVLVP